MAAQPPVTDLLELSPEFVSNPYPVYEKLRRQAPVHHVRTPDGDDVWLVVGHEACRAAFTDPRLSREWRRSGRMSQIKSADQDDPNLAHLLMADPPDHTRLRRLVSRDFTPRRIAALAPRVQQVTDELLDAMLAGPDRRADRVEACGVPPPPSLFCGEGGVAPLGR
ncbi:cytochrome P450, partial [Streptomyces sp. NPDC059766]